MPDTTYIYCSRLRLLKLIFAGFVFILLSLYLFLAPKESGYLAKFPDWLIEGVGLVGLVFFSFFIIEFVIVIVSGKPRMIFSEDAFIFRLMTGVTWRINWNDVEYCEVQKGNDLTSKHGIFWFYLKNPASHAERPSWYGLLVGRFMLWGCGRPTGTVVAVTPSALDCSMDQLMTLFIEYMPEGSRMIDKRVVKG